ncbi:MAG: non-reducing end alpha-L-arabinofuranosidase family hydrolase [Planctomycetaceae bacterium]
MATGNSAGPVPFGWSEPQLAINGDIFEASHTYRLKGLDQYLTIVECEHGHGFRYFKAYVADRLDGDWQPLAATKENAFASLKNVTQPGDGWTAAISHGELIRTGADQRLEVDPSNLQFLFQGVSARDREGKQYGEIPWQLGLLNAVPADSP